MKGIFLHIVILAFAIFRIDFVCSNSLYSNTSEDLNDVVFVLDQQENSLLTNNNFNSEYIYTETFIQSKSFRGNINNKIKTVFPYIFCKKDCDLKSYTSLENNRFICQYNLPFLFDGNKSVVLRL